MARITGMIAAALLTLVAAPAANATVLTFTADLNGANQNPTNSSAATGNVMVWWDTTANTMHVNVTFSGLTAPATAAHIHCCIAEPGNVGVATALPYFPGFPLGVTSGTYDMTFDMTDLASYNSAFVTANGGTAAGAEAALLAGIENDMAYFNIHDANYPGGEIRGFLRPPVCGSTAPGGCAVPEPMSLSLVGFGLFGAFAARRRKSRR